MAMVLFEIKFGLGIHDDADVADAVVNDTDMPPIAKEDKDAIAIEKDGDDESSNVMYGG